MVNTNIDYNIANNIRWYKSTNCNQIKLMNMQILSFPYPTGQGFSDLSHSMQVLFTLFSARLLLLLGAFLRIALVQ